MHELSHLLANAEQQLQAAKPDWADLLCYAGLIYRQQQQHPILAHIAQQLQASDVDYKACFQQLNIARTFELFHESPRENLYRFDRICAAARWLGIGHALQNYSDMLIFSMQVDPEPWLPLVTEARNVLQKAAPLEGDPARMLWVSVNSILPTDVDVENEEVEEASDSPQKVQCFLLPEHIDASTDGDRLAQHIVLWETITGSASIRIAGDTATFLVTPSSETSKITVTKNGQPMTGDLLVETYEYEVVPGRWMVDFGEQVFAVDICTSAETKGYSAVLWKLQSSNPHAVDEAYDQLLFDRTPQATDALIAAYRMAGHTADLRFLGVQILGFKGDASATDCLIDALDDSFPSIRREACMALEELKAGKALDAVQQLLIDPDVDVRAAARDAYRSLKSA